MYLRGNKWTMTKRSRRPNLWRIILLLGLIGAALYVNQVVVPATPPMFIPTPTPTRSPESYVSQAEELYRAGKFTQAIEAYKEAILADPSNPSNYVTLARLQVFAGKYDEAITNAQNALLKNPNNPTAHAVLGWALGFQEKYGEELQRQHRGTRSVDRTFRRLCKRLGIKPITPHGLRHYFATYALMNGAKLEIVSKILGHASIGITADVYRTVKQDEVQAEHAKYSPLADKED